MTKRSSLTLLFGAALLVLASLLSGCASPGRISRNSLPESTTSSPDTTPLPAQNAELIFEAVSLVGVPYRSGGNNPETGFDCSGLVRYVFKTTLGQSLPHNAEEIGRLGLSIAPEQLRAGDLVFYNTQGKTNSHVGIYLGDQRFIHAPSERGVVRIENMNLPYWVQRFDGARRLN
jgi:cell wall-associated NlpC family hydrolase